MIVPPTSPTQAGDPLRIDSVQTPGGGRIGLVHCPGRSRTDAAGRMTTRDLDEDLAAIEAWGASVLVSLVEAAEFERLGAGELPATVKQRSFAWLHAPIPDMQAPPVDAVATLTHHAPELIAALQRGERIVIHCAAGLGRSGSIAAWLLVEMGAEPQAAIDDVRRARPGAIETAAQERFVHFGSRLAKPPYLGGSHRAKPPDQAK